jgi:hypothetical protein
MSKHFNFKSIALFLSVISFLSSCTGDDKKNDETTNAATSTTTVNSTNTAVAAEPKKTALTGTLDNLWVLGTKFQELSNGKKVVFSFTFRDPDILTLWGWQCHDNNCTNNFSTNPDLQLNKGKPSAANYGPNVIFGNVVIFRDGIKAIKDKLGSTYQYVVFVPYNDGEYIRYKIYVTNDDPGAALTALNLEDTGIETNPSPPKNNAN